MKRQNIFILTILLLIGILISGVAPAYADSNQVTLKIDGKVIPTDVAPVIKNDRVLVPARAVFEGIGGKVFWDSKKPSDIGVQYGNIKVDLKINSNVAYVNGKAKTLEVPAQLVNDRTLIPLRFVSESLNFTVGFDDKTRTVLITTTNGGNTTNYSEIKNVAIGSQGEKTRVSITSNTPITQYSKNSLGDPWRFYIDIPDAKYYSNNTNISYNNSTSAVSGTRIWTGENNVTRVTVDLKENATPNITFSADKKSMYLDFDPSSQPVDDGKFVVMLDPGHGITTGGKRSPDESLLEYEFNRDVANRVKAILEKNGIEVLMTVYDDADTSLAERCNNANRSNADVFVSIHANAFGRGEWSSAKGWEIYVYKKGGEAEKLAKSIQDATMDTVTINNRGLKEAEFYVIKYTDMPAVLIEHGFYTNKDEVELLKSSSFRQQLAEADAAGIMNYYKNK